MLFTCVRLLFNLPTDLPFAYFPRPAPRPACTTTSTYIANIAQSRPPSLWLHFRCQRSRADSACTILDSLSATCAVQQTPETATALRWRRRTINPAVRPGIKSTMTITIKAMLTTARLLRRKQRSAIFLKASRVCVKGPSIVIKR